MVNEKTILVMFLIVIFLSIISIALTILTLNMKLVPPQNTLLNIGNSEDSQAGQISIVINPPAQTKK